MNPARAVVVECAANVAVETARKAVEKARAATEATCRVRDAARRGEPANVIADAADAAVTAAAEAEDLAASVEADALDVVAEFTSARRCLPVKMTANDGPRGRASRDFPGCVAADTRAEAAVQTRPPRQTSIPLNLPVVYDGPDGPHQDPLQDWKPRHPAFPVSRLLLFQSSSFEDNPRMSLPCIVFLREFSRLSASAGQRTDRTEAAGS